METPYIIGLIIVVVVIAVAAWLLRDRLTAGRSGVPGGEKIEPDTWNEPLAKKRRPSLPEARIRPPRMAPSTAPLASSQVMNIWRHGVNFARNRLLGKPPADIRQPAGSTPAVQSPRRRRRKK